MIGAMWIMLASLPVKSLEGRFIYSRKLLSCLRCNFSFIHIVIIVNQLPAEVTLTWAVHIKC
jgi:hypothetical protein